jgi:hypothetical protein
MSLSNKKLDYLIKIKTLSRYAASAAAPYPFNFIQLGLDG